MSYRRLIDVETTLRVYWVDKATTLYVRGSQFKTSCGCWNLSSIINIKYNIRTLPLLFCVSTVVSLYGHQMSIVKQFYTNTIKFKIGIKRSLNFSDFLWQAIFKILYMNGANVRGGSRAAATSKMERFVIIANGFQPLTIITKRSVLDVAAALDPPLNIFLRCIIWNICN